MSNENLLFTFLVTGNGLFREITSYIIITLYYMFGGKSGSAHEIRLTGLSCIDKMIGDSFIFEYI